MKILFFIIPLFCFFNNVPGQISGKLTRADGQPIAFANILLLKRADTALVKAALTDEKGIFRIEPAEKGSYILQFSSIGYRTWNSAAFEISESQKTKDFGVQIMAGEKKQLEEVVVRAARPLYQQRVDGMVINAESSVLTKGSSVLELLERSPGVIINYRDNSITLNGKTGVTVMLNGKPMRMSMEQLIAFLNSLSANDIEKIELLTTPPSNYDAEGSAGIINIVLKKTSKRGTNGSFSVSAGYGRREKGTGSINIGHNSGKINTYGSYSFSHDRSKSDFSAQGSEIVPMWGAATFAFWNQTNPVKDSHNATAGIDAALNAKTTLGGNISYNNSHSSTYVFNRADYVILPDSVLLLNGNINGINRTINWTSSFYAERKLKDGEKLSLDLDHLYYDNNNPTAVQSSFIDKDGQQTGMNSGNQFAPSQKGFSNTVIQVGIIRMDYAKQLNKKLRLETGIKGTYTKSSSTSGIKSLVDGEWISRSETANDIIMKEGIGAAYASVNAEISPRSKLVIGARYEYARMRINNQKSGENTADRKLGVLFPSIFFSRKLNDRAELQFSYTKRISRPTYNDLTSFIAYNDPISVFTGNPLLKPTITNNIKFGYNYLVYSFSILFSRGDYPIAEGQLTPGNSGNVVYISPQNLTYQNNISLQTNLPFKINNWWSMNYSFTGGWRQYKIDYLVLPVKKAYFGYSLNFSESLKLPRDFSAEISGWYNSSFYGGAAKIKGFGALNAGVKKELKKNGGSFQLSVTDFLRTTNVNIYIGDFSQDAFSTRAHVNFNPESMKFPIIKLTYSRSFGSGARDKRKQDASSDERDRIRKNQ